MEIFRVFRFEASHRLLQLPLRHPCGKVHGHSWRVEIHAAGPVLADRGWVLDFADLERAFQPLLLELDHTHLNDIEGLEQPTCENIAQWIWRRLKPALPALARIVIWETETAGCSHRGEPETG